MTKLIQNLRENVPGAENALLEYTETHYFNDNEQLELISFLKFDKLKDAVKNILLKCARKNMLCTKAHEELANLLKDTNCKDAAKEILLACLEGWGIWTEGLVVLVNLLENTDCHVATDAKKILLSQVEKWFIGGRALSQLIMQENKGVKAASEVLKCCHNL
ncbi:MAG: hypothetical protein J6W96_04360 [Alphaproteobacteria bacterium]|nr:hypothetical protein [Alphaproteobacteria bacterium]